MNELKDKYYTLAKWKVKPGNEQVFIEAWTKLGEVFTKLEHPSLHGTLLRNLEDETLFYSYGPWNNLSDIEEMRANPECRNAIRNVMNLCEIAEPGNYKVEKEINLEN